MSPDTLLLDRVAQPFADRFLRDDQAQRVAAFLLPGAGVALLTFFVARPSPLEWIDGVSLGCTAYLITRWLRDLRAAAGRRDGLSNPLRVTWVFHRWSWLAVAVLEVGATTLFGRHPYQFALVVHGALLVSALYLGSTNRPAGVQDRRWVSAGGVA